MTLTLLLSLGIGAAFPTVLPGSEIMARTDIGFDGAILTKADADVRGGAALSIVYSTGKPVLFLGVGQEYDDRHRSRDDDLGDLQPLVGGLRGRTLLREPRQLVLQPG